MSCVAIFKVGDKKVSLDLETGPDSYLTDQEIIEILTKNPEKRQELCNLVQNKLYRQNIIEPVKVSDLIGLSGLRGNTDVESLSNEFPKVNFPQGVSANILLVNNLDIGKRNIKGRIINSNGEEVFIVQYSDDLKDLHRLAGFLQVRKQILDQSFIFDENSIYYKNLQECLKQRNKREQKVKDIYDMLLDFNQNKKKYQSLYFTDDKGKDESVYAYLTKINNIILQYSDRVVFMDPFVNVVNQLRNHLDTNEGFISYAALYGAIKQYHKDILEKLNITTQKDFKEFFSSNETSEELSKIFPYEDGMSRYEQLLRGLFSVEPEFSWNYARSTSKGIILHSSPKTLLAKYGIEYDTIHSFDIIDDDFFGYKLYRFTDRDNNQRYTYSRGFLTEYHFSKIFDSLNNLKKFVQSSVVRQDIKKNSFVEFKYREKLDDGWTTELSSFNVKSTQSLIPGSIVESIDVPVSKNQEIYISSENNLFKASEQNYNNFTKIVQSWNISDELKNNIIGDINTPEKITIFIYKINELLKGDRSDEKTLSSVLNLIQNAGKNYYYIDTKEFGRGYYKYRVIPTNPVQVENYKEDKHVPVVQLITAINQVLQSNFGVTINMLTSSEISQQYPEVDANTTRAFVHNGEIFINTTLAESTDPLHEFTHIILGVLKASPQLRNNYEQLMYLVSQTREGENKIKTLKNTYTDASQMDLMEEAFVDLFSEHMLGKLNPGFEQIFTSVDKYMTDATKIVFNNAIEDLGSFYGSSIQTVFTRFNSDIASLLNNKLDFSSANQSRRLSNWISEQIKEGNIKEECYG